MQAQNVAVITGATRGLGFETAKQLATKGYRVILTGRSEAQGKKAQAQLAQEGLKAEFYLLDVSCEKASAFGYTCATTFAG